MNFGGCAFVGHQLRIAKDAAREGGHFFAILASGTLAIRLDVLLTPSLEGSTTIKGTLSGLRVGVIGLDDKGSGMLADAALPRRGRVPFRILGGHRGAFSSGRCRGDGVTVEEEVGV